MLTLHVGLDTAPAHAPPHCTNEYPLSGVAVSVIRSDGLYRAVHVTVAAQSILPVASVIEPPVPGVAVSRATSAVCRLEPANRSLSTSPLIPPTLPVQEYCQNVHPSPCQSCAGIDVGSGARGHANHSGNP